MNDFTKEETKYLLDSLSHWDEDFEPPAIRLSIIHKLTSIIEGHCNHNAKWIAKAHLDEAESLIHHAKCLLGIGDE